MSDQKPPAPSQVPLEIRSADYRDVYANFSRVGMSQWDLALVFGTINDNVGGQVPEVTTEISVRMSPHQFKAFASALPLIIAEWEKRFGEINLPPSAQISAQGMHSALAKAFGVQSSQQSPAEGVRPSKKRP